MNLYKKYGAFKQKNGYRFVTYAPAADKVYLIINSEKHLMNQIDGHWELLYNNINKDTAYSYLIEKDKKQFEKSDPFARKVVSHKTAEMQSYTTESSYEWKNTKPENKQNIKICEVFMEILQGDNYKEKAKNLIEYLNNKKFTHIQIMPICHFTDIATLGYMTNSYFCPSTRYGEPDDFKYFIDKMHEHGYAVILDIVFFEFGTDSKGLNNYDGGYLFNKNKQEKNIVFGGYIMDLNKKFIKNFISSIMNYYIKEFNVDGFRFDAINEVIFSDMLNTTLDLQALQNIKDIINNIDDCLIIVENISAIDYDQMEIKKVRYIENSNYMYQINHLFNLKEDERFKHKDYTEIEKHNIRFMNNKNLLSSVTHDIFLEGGVIKKDINSYIKENNKCEKQKIKIAMIYSTIGDKLLFKDYDIGFENTDIKEIVQRFINVFDTKITNDYVSFKIKTEGKIVKYEYVYKDKKINILFNLSDEIYEINKFNEVLFNDDRIVVNKDIIIVKPYSFLVFL